MFELPLLLPNPLLPLAGSLTYCINFVLSYNHHHRHSFIKQSQWSKVWARSALPPPPPPPPQCQKLTVLTLSQVTTIITGKALSTRTSGSMFQLHLTLPTLLAPTPTGEWSGTCCVNFVPSNNHHHGHSLINESQWSMFELLCPSPLHFSPTTGRVRNLLCKLCP